MGEGCRDKGADLCSATSPVPMQYKTLVFWLCLREEIPSVISMLPLTATFHSLKLLQQQSGGKNVLAYHTTWLG